MSWVRVPPSTLSKRKSLQRDCCRDSLFPGLSDGYPHPFALVFCVGNLLHHAVEPQTGVEHLAHFAVFTYEDATLGVLCCVAGMDAYALPLSVEHWTAEQYWQPCFELRRIADDYGVPALWYGTSALHLVCSVFVVSPRGFESVAEVSTVDGFSVWVETLAHFKFAYRVGLAFCYTSCLALKNVE